MNKIAIIDDNKGARNAIKNILTYNFDDTFSIKEANSVLSGHKLILEYQPDIVLLDVEMGDGTGLDLVNLFPEIPFKLIFITAHKDYAIKAIKHRPHDYLLKPVNPFDLIKAINTLLTENKTQKQPVDASKKITIKNQDATVLLDVTEIIRCEADGAYTKIITKKTAHLASKNLKHFTELLEKSGFLRVHHSHLINPDYIKKFNRHVQEGIVLKNGDKIPVSSRKISVITGYLNRLG